MRIVYSIQTAERKKEKKEKEKEDREKKNSHMLKTIIQNICGVLRASSLVNVDVCVCVCAVWHSFAHLNLYIACAWCLLDETMPLHISTYAFVHCCV